MKTHFLPTRLLLILLSFTLINIASCKKDDNSDNPFTNSGATLKTTVLGTVQDTDGKIMSGVTVKLGSYTTITDQRGMFVFNNVDVAKDRLVLRASMDGYFNCIKGKKTQTGGVNYAQLIMEQKQNPSVIQSGAGGIVTIPGGAQITFPANAFVDANGNSYSGTVKIYSRHISPGNNNFEAIVPGGDLIGINSTGQIKSLYSFGMIEALLTDNSGINELKLAPGKTAELKFPIDPSQGSQALNTIPLWHLDEVTGVWNEEGQAIKNGNSFVGNVSHFTTWNCDYQGDRTNISGTVVDCQGVPVPSIVVTINGFLNVTTNNNGEFATWVPSGYSISCQALMQYNSFLIADSPIQTITAQGGILNIIPPIVVSCATRISGTVTNCLGNLPYPSIIAISWNGGSRIIYTNTGSYSNIFVNSESNITINAMYQNYSSSTSVISGPAGTNTTVPNIKICNVNSAVPIGFNLVANNVYTYYSITPTSIFKNFIDTNNDGIFEQASIIINGIYNTSLDSCSITIGLYSETNGYYSLTSSSQNNIYIQIHNGNTTTPYANGLFGSISSNKLVISDYGAPGGVLTGTFEYDHASGVITNGTFSVPR